MVLSFSARCPDSLCQRLPSSSIRLSCLLEPIVKHCQDHVCITTRRVVLLTFMSHRFSQIKKSVAAQVHYKRHTFSCSSFQVFRSFFYILNFANGYQTFTLTIPNMCILFIPNTRRSSSSGTHIIFNREIIIDIFIGCSYWYNAKSDFRNAYMNTILILIHSSRYSC